MIANNYNSVLNALVKQKITLFDLEGLKHIDPQTALEARITFLKIRKKRRTLNKIPATPLANLQGYYNAPDGYCDTFEAAARADTTRANVAYYINKYPNFRELYVVTIKKRNFISPEGIKVLKNRSKKGYEYL